MNGIRYGNDGLLSTAQDTMAGSKPPSITVEFVQIVGMTPICWKGWKPRTERHRSSNSLGGVSVICRSLVGRTVRKLYCSPSGSEVGTAWLDHHSAPLSKLIPNGFDTSCTTLILNRP
jgi:hypothetical protein